MSKQIIVTEVEVKAAMDAAKSQEVKDVLAALFCKPEKSLTWMITSPSSPMRMLVRLWIYHPSTLTMLLRLCA